MSVVVHAANIHDSVGAKLVLQKVEGTLPRLQKIFADAAYQGPLEEWVQKYLHATLEIVRKKDKRRFVVLPKRWIGERTFGWLNRQRRLSKDYEQFAETSENIIYIAMINLMLHRLCPEKDF
jgi:transposase